MQKISRILTTLVVAFATSGVIALVPQAQSASALSGCTQYGTARVSTSNGWSTYEPYYQQLSYGSRSECVKSLQRMVNVFCTSDTDLAVDGIYGTKTYRAVKTIQYVLGKNWNAYPRVNGAAIIEDGIAGKQTWAILQAFGYWPGNIDCRYR
jgi:peptidoglycan hydrolase-like protein with peptidoglycan-binding domain